ncbi:Metallothionein-like protein 4B [Bienertia sinuspersici]
MEHKRCSCGEHCSCNPCTCSNTEVRGTGKASCKCGSGCTCQTCAA